MTPLLFLVWLFCGVILFILGWLRFVKGRFALREGEGIEMGAIPQAAGVVLRLDGIERRNRVILDSRRPRGLEDGSVALPLSRWATSPMTIARLALVAHTWAMARQAEADPEGHRQRERAVARARVIPILVFFLSLILLAAGRCTLPMAFTLVLGVWTMTIIVSIPSQFREWKAVEIAREGLKSAGLYPQSRLAAGLLNRSLSALSWCRVAGFRQVVPR